MKIQLSTVMLMLGLSWSVMAQDSSPMREGMWEINSKLNIPGMGDGVPMKHQQCITAAMIKDPQAAIPKMGNDCKVSNYRLAANTATYTLTCTNPTDIVGNGEIKYAGPDSYTGTLTLGAQGASYTLTYEAKRTGDCSK
jgi:Protein of unknown function (DUF3617)